MNKGHMIAPMELVQDLKDKVNNGTSVSAKDETITLSLENWILDESNNTYSQTVTVDGMTATSNPVVLLSGAADDPTDDEEESYACISSITTADDSITFVVDKMPKVSFDVIIKNVVNAEGGNDDVAELEGRIDELEAEVDSKFNTTNQNVTNNANAITQLTSDKANVSHTHDDRYYTASAMGDWMASKADKSELNNYIPRWGADLTGGGSIASDGNIWSTVWGGDWLSNILPKRTLNYNANDVNTYNLLLYDYGNGNNAGIGVDSNGTVIVRTGVNNTDIKYLNITAWGQIQTNQEIHCNGIHTGGAIYTNNGNIYIGNSDTDLLGAVMLNQSQGAATPDWLLLMSGDSGVQAKTLHQAAWAPFTGSAFNKVSSRKVKENINNMTEDEASKLLDIDVVSFDYIEKIGGEKNQYGVIAEDTIEKIPFAVTIPKYYDESSDDTDNVPTVDYSKFVPYLIKMVQIQQNEINELKSLIK